MRILDSNTIERLKNQLEVMENFLTLDEMERKASSSFVMHELDKVIEYAKDQIRQHDEFRKKSPEEQDEIIGLSWVDPEDRILAHISTRDAMETLLKGYEEEKIELEKFRHLPKEEQDKITKASIKEARFEINLFEKTVNAMRSLQEGD